MRILEFKEFRRLILEDDPAPAADPAAAMPPPPDPAAAMPPPPPPPVDMGMPAALPPDPNAAPAGPTSTTGLEVPLTLWSQSDCKRQWSYGTSFFSGFVCSQGRPSATVCNGDSGGPLFVTVGGQRKLAGVLSFGSAAGCGINFTVHTRVNTYIDFLRQYALGAPPVIIPALPTPPTQVITDIELPTLPSFAASKPIFLPKFSISRTFQLVLSGSTKCSIYIDSATSLKGVTVRVFIGRATSKAVKTIILDEFGDSEFRVSNSCANIRKNGVYVSRTDSSVKTQAIE